MSQAVISPTTRWFNSANGTVVLNTKTGRYYNLNKTATVIWPTLVRSGSFAEIESQLSKQFELPVERVRWDLTKLFDKLEEAGLIKLVPGTSHQHKQ